MSLKGNGDTCRLVYKVCVYGKIVINIVEIYTIVLFYALETKAKNK